MVEHRIAGQQLLQGEDQIDTMISVGIATRIRRR